MDSNQKGERFIIKECNRKKLVLLQASHVPAQIMDVWSPLQVAALLCAPGEKGSGLNSLRAISDSGRG